MKILLVLFAALTLSGCCGFTETETYAGFADVHEKVFGCYPKDYTPQERTLEAVGPTVETDFLGNECGMPVYKSPCVPCPKSK